MELENLSGTRKSLAWAELLEISKDPSGKFFILVEKGGKITFGKISKNDDLSLLFYRIIDAEGNIATEKTITLKQSNLANK